MYAPPPSYIDMLADAKGWPPAGPLDELTVDGVGVVEARRPGPAGVAALAMAANPDLEATERASYLVRFVADHLGEGELDRLYFGMMVDSLPADTFERVSRALAVWGTARPYVAVVTLAVIASCHWRALRLKIVSTGVVAPMGLESMHVLLDFAEAAVIDTFKNVENPQQELTSFYRRLYGPSAEANRLNGDDYVPVPPGFSEDEVEDAFDAFVQAAR
jgi:hypothetical protein